MDAIINHPGVKELLTSLASSDLNLTTAIAWLIITTILSMIGGAIGGMILAGKELGYQFSATIGSLFAPAGVVPAIILGILMLNLFTNF
jgi:ABC-type spermidine/putrescine transport system permease subunit II